MPRSLKIMSFIVYFSVFFPYIKIIDLGTDTQPTAFIVSLFVVFLFTMLKRYKMPRELVPLLIAALFSILVGSFDGFSFTAMRGVFGYISVFIITYATYIIMKKDVGISKVFLKIIILIWGIIGLIQTMVHPYFLMDIVSGGMRTTATRGVTALAPEATYYGQIVYFLLFMVLFFFENKKDKILYSVLCLIQIFLFAKSAMIALILSLVLVVLVIDIIIYKWSFKTIMRTIIVLSVIIIVLFSFGNFPSDTRMVTSMDKIIEDPIGFFKKDASSNDRLSAIYFSFKGAFDNYLLPNGFEKWVEYSTHAKLSSEFFWYGETERIMCMYGAILFELGAIGLIYLYIINRWLWELIKMRRQLQKYKLTILFFVNLIFMTAVPLSTPFVGFLLGILLYHIKILKSKKQVFKHGLGTFKA